MQSGANGNHLSVSIAAANNYSLQTPHEITHLISITVMSSHCCRHSTLEKFVIWFDTI